MNAQPKQYYVEGYGYKFNSMIGAERFCRTIGPILSVKYFKIVVEEIILL